MKIQDYLRDHTIVEISSSLPGYVCCDIIIDDPIALISVVRDNNCYISEISWWDRVKITTGSSIGYGGAKDPRCPNKYFFAETDIGRVFSACSNDKEYYIYLEQIRSIYSAFDLFPAFDIKRR